MGALVTAVKQVLPHWIMLVLFTVGLCAMTQHEPPPPPPPEYWWMVP